tara:strand:+ start:2620 stop:5430 length:2811 start_codon:yes stop_codon:yes gene_type:complete
MSFYDAIRVGASGASTGYEVERSLRFNHTDSTELKRTVSSTGNQKVWTWSAWFKRWGLHDNGGTSYLFSCEPHSGNNGIAALYIQSDQIYTYFDTTGSNPYGAVNDRKYRDVSAWMHIVWQVDAANTSQRIWINGVEESLNSGNNPPDYAYGMNQSGQPMMIGSSGNWGASQSNTYFAEIHYSDGNKYEASDFAETDVITGQWVPKKVNITYGTNGFYLNFSDNSGTTATTLGKDSSGNSNNFTPYNFEVGTGVGNDSVPDTPTNNFPTLNPLYNPVNTTFGEGNLLMRGGDNFAASTFLLPKSGKWYAEFSKYNNGALQSISVTRANTAMTNYAGYLGLADNVEYVSNGELGNRTRGSTSDATAWTNDANIIVAVAVDMDNGAVYFARANTWQNSGDPTSGSSKTGAIATDLLTDNNGDHVIAVHGYNANSSYGLYANFGQQPLTYTPPTGYKVLSSANLPDPTILLPNKHFDTLLYSGTGSANSVTGLNFAPDWVWAKVRSHSGDHLLVDQVRGGSKSLNSNNTDTESSLANRDATFLSNGIRWNGNSLTCNESGKTYVAWNWDAGETDGKTYTVTVVSDSGNKYRFDGFGTSAVTLDLAEGGTYIFNMDDSSNATHPFSIGTAANGTVYTSGITYFLDGVSKTYSQYTSGFAAASTRRLHITVPASAPQLYYWCSAHSGMGGAINTNTTLGSSNFDGNNQSTVKVSQTAGFSIVGYVGNGANNTNVTMGHGLGVAPDAVILKNRDTSPYGAREWVVWHQDVGTDSTYVYKNLTWNTTVVPGANSDQFRTVDANTIQVRSTDSTNGKVNANNNKYIAYVFSEVAGYSKFGKYTGNNANDGTFVFTGFSVAWLMVKRIDSSRDWLVYDNKRSTFNVIDDFLEPNQSGSEQSSSSNSVDFLSNGFKFRNNSGDMNGSGTYVYFAFAESPFKNSRAR